MNITIDLRNEDWSSAEAVAQDIAAHVRGQFCRYPKGLYEAGPPLQVIITVIEVTK